MSELAFSIALENSKIFDNLSHQQTKMLLMTSKLFHTEHIVRQNNKHTIVQYHQNIFRTFVSLAHLRRNKNEEQIHIFEAKLQKMFQNIFNMDIELQDSFFRLFIAYFKRNIHMLFSAYDHILYCTLLEYNRVLDSYKTIDEMVESHKHNHDHYIFKGVNRIYDFEDLYEKRGVNLMEKWNITSKRI